MKPKIGPVRLASGGRLAFLAVGLVVCGAFVGKPANLLGQTNQKPTAAPPFALQPGLILQKKSDFMNHVLRDLKFDSGPAVDSRRLLVKGPHDSLVVGPPATLAPLHPP